MIPHDADTLWYYRSTPKCQNQVYTSTKHLLFLHQYGSEHLLPKHSTRMLADHYGHGRSCTNIHQTPDAFCSNLRDSRHESKPSSEYPPFATSHHAVCRSCKC